MVMVMMMKKKMMMMMMMSAQIQGANSPGRPNFAKYICESVWNLLHVTLIEPKILRWLTDFWKIVKI